MPDDLHPDIDSRRRSDDTLARVAAALGRSRSAFLDGTDVPDDLAGAAELLRHWRGLTNGTDRRKVLAFVRAVATARTKGVAAE